MSQSQRNQSMVADSVSADSTSVERRPWITRRRGTALLLIVILLIGFLATAALSVDIAYMHVINIELQASTDAAALAAVEILGQTQDLSKARAAAKQIAAANPVGGEPLILADADIVFGRSLFQNTGSLGFTAGDTHTNAAQVIGRREQGTASGPVGLFFARIFDIQEWDTQRTAIASRWDRDIALVVDRSNSMNIENKLIDLKAAVAIFLDVLETNGYEDRVGLASYNQAYSLDQQLTSSLSLIESKMNAIIASGQTNIGGGINTGRAILISPNARPNTEKTMILMTDGLHNTGQNPLTAAYYASVYGIVIHTITFGDEADQELMRLVAERTGGETYHAPDGETLKDIYRKIAQSFRTVLID